MYTTTCYKYKPTGGETTATSVLQVSSCVSASHRSISLNKCAFLASWCCVLDGILYSSQAVLGRDVLVSAIVLRTSQYGSPPWAIRLNGGGVVWISVTVRQSLIGWYRVDSFDNVKAF